MEKDEKLVLAKPVTPFLVGQNFGEDLACVSSDFKIVIARPDGGVCPVGYQSLYKASGTKGHTGLDIKAYRWQPIYSSAEGFVEEVETEERRGLGLGIITNKKYDLGIYGIHHVKVRYWHLAAYNVKRGDQIKPGQLIGWADNTGYSAGDHLHYEIKPVYQVGNEWWNVYQDNGYHGGINPLFFMGQLTAFEINSFFTRIRYQVIDILNQVQDNLSKGPK